jgi:predicted RNase H-like HicB family nuclease
MPVAYALIHEENGSFGISFPDFPGCISGGSSAEEAFRKGAEALSFHVQGMHEDGDAIPVLRSLADLKNDPDFTEDAEDATIALVSFELPSRAVRINVSIEESLLSHVDAAASASGQSRSAFMAGALRRALTAA